MDTVPKCELCQRNQATLHSTCRKTGKRQYKRTCNTCYRHRHELPKLPSKKVMLDIDRPACETCQVKPARYMRLYRGQHLFSRYCNACLVSRRQSPDYRPRVLTSEEHALRKKLGLLRNNSKNSYRIHLKDSCERCGFVPEEYCQLVIHHLDENHSNNEPVNLQTLCHNCHNLVHFRSRKVTSTTR